MTIEELEKHTIEGFNTLNEKYDNIETLIEEITTLKNELNSVKSDWNDMKIQFQALKNSYNKLNKSYTITVFEFFDKFTVEEFSVFLKTMENDIILKVMYEKMKIAQEITLTEKIIIDGLNYLVKIGILTAVRKEEILLP